MNLADEYEDALIYVSRCQRAALNLIQRRMHMTDLGNHLRGKSIATVGIRSNGNIVLRDDKAQIIMVISDSRYLFDPDGNHFNDADTAGDIRMKGDSE